MSNRPAPATPPQPAADASGDEPRQPGWPRARSPDATAQTRVQVQAMVDAYRRYGYFKANINPLRPATAWPNYVADLDPTAYDLSDDGATSYTATLNGSERSATLSGLAALLEAAYCGPIGLNAGHLRSARQRHWLQDRLESRLDDAPASAERQAFIFRQIVGAETFERHLRKTYPGHKRFSLEGCESLILLLQGLVERAARHEVSDVLIGMPHRGRLSVMHAVMGIPLARIFSLFTDEPHPDLAAWDIKEHVGCTSERATPGGPLRLLLAHNPSHLESVTPVVCGMARAVQDRQSAQHRRRILPLVVHGDASFCGQGIVCENFNISQTRGYHVGGTVHVVLNNQIGSTVSHASDARSMLHCADIARAIDAPILHVNGDEPEAVLFAIEAALDFRQAFGVDVVVDLVGYRRFGHNGHDDPTMTQPAMQRVIQAHPTVVDRHEARLLRTGVLEPALLEAMRREAEQALIAASQEPAGAGAQAGAGQATPAARPAAPATASAASAARPTAWERPVHTGVPVDVLHGLVDRLIEIPPGFDLHPDIRGLLRKWTATRADPAAAVDWCIAENLAYASLLKNGFNVRLTGLDVGRGSFFHRQAVWHDQAGGVDGEHAHVPLRHLGGDQGVFSIFDTPLSEEAVLGFEYGYTLQGGRDLVLWEAQFGDFVNNAQVIIDQYISAGEAKWGYRSGLVMLLPHGNEGGGPEHSSAYLGRFLALCGDDNLRVAMPSSSAQFFHLLRRQALVAERKPLVVMSPKGGLYGNVASHAPWRAFEQADFQVVIGDGTIADPARVTRVLLTSGKAYYDVARERDRRGAVDTAVVRVEQLFPFPVEAVARQLARFPSLRDVAWVQEEARNHGAWFLLRDQVEAALPARIGLRCAGRPSAAPCAVARSTTHQAELAALLAAAFDGA